MRILAAIVTHNRAGLLSRCIDHVLAQTCPPEALVVIDNASTDGTRDMLAARGVTCITQANEGSAGGWRRAIAHGLEHGYDQIWLMDDDGYPGKAALGRLVRRADADVSCVASVVVREDAPDRFVFPFPFVGRNGLPVLFRLPRKLKSLPQLAHLASSGVYPFAHLFNGTLVSAAAARRAGNVNAGYYLYGDEVDYFFRLRQVGRVVSDLGALHYHPNVSRRPLDERRVYYYVKNSMILHRLYFDHAALRNLGALVMALWRIWHRNGAAEAARYTLGRKRAILAAATRRGWSGDPAIDFDG